MCLINKTDVKKDFWLTFSLSMIGLVVGICITKLSGVGITHALKKMAFHEIFNHNAGVALLILTIGALTFGVGGLVILFLNGVTMRIASGSLSLEQIILLLLPYTVFELLSFVCVALAGIAIAKNIREFRKGKKFSSLINDWPYVRLLLAVTFFLLAIAGFIEVYL